MHTKRKIQFDKMGSQVDLVLPLDSRYNFETILDDTMHVNAGLDKLVKINQTKQCHQTTITTKSLDKKG